MNSVFLTNNDIKVGENTSLPQVIRLVQNRDDNLGNSSSSNIIERRKAQAGTLGNSFYDFTMDFTCAPIEICKDNDPFKEINIILQNQTSPTFTRNYFLKNYIVLEIQDYGHQSMSPGFRDFVPWVFIDGKKIWQKYVGMIRQYSKRKAYLIINKNNNLSETFTLSDDDEIKIRCVFKNNIEDKNSEQQTRNLKLQSTGENQAYIKFIVDKGTADQSIDSFIYLDNQTVSDYDIIYTENNKEYKLPIFPGVVKVFVENAQSINKQNYETSAKKLEYYRQAYVHDYAGEDGNTYERDIEGVRYSIYFSRTVYGDILTSKNLKIRSKQNAYNAIYTDGDSNTIPYFNDFDKNYFNKDGKRVYALEGLSEFEVIPEYSSRKKYIFKYSGVLSNNTNISDLLYSKGLISFYPKEALSEVLLYTGGVYMGIGNSSTIGSFGKVNKESSLEIYVDISLLEPTNPTSISECKSFTFDGNSSTDTFYKDKLNSVLKITNNKISEVYDSVISNDDIEIYAVARCFPIPYEKIRIGKSAYLFRLPEYVRTDNLFYSLENCMYIKSNDNTTNLEELKIYADGDKLGPETPEESFYISNSERLASLNIINLSKSDPKSRMITYDNYKE